MYILPLLLLLFASLRDDVYVNLGTSGSLISVHAEREPSASS